MLVADLQRMRTQTARNAVKIHKILKIFLKYFKIFSVGGGGPDDSLPGGDAVQSDGAPRDRQGRNDGKLNSTKLLRRNSDYI